MKRSRRVQIAGLTHHLSSSRASLASITRSYMGDTPAKRSGKLSNHRIKSSRATASTSSSRRTTLAGGGSRGGCDFVQK